jgi:hypothetical protein
MGPEKKNIFLITKKIETETKGVLLSVLVHVVLVFERELCSLCRLYFNAGMPWNAMFAALQVVTTHANQKTNYNASENSYP